MKSQLGGLYAALCSTGLMLAGCESSKGLLEQTAESMGGAALESATFERTVGTGERFDPGEATAPGKNYKPVDLTQERLLDLRAGSSRIRYQGNSNALFPVRLDYTEVINGNTGYVDGADFLFNPTPQQAPMSGSRLAARERESWLVSPSRLLKAALTSPERVREEAPLTREGKSYQVLSVTVPQGAEYKLLVDPDTHRVARTETLMDHPPLGDMLISAVFEDYRQVEGVQVPGRVTIWGDNYQLQNETRSVVELPSSVQENPFLVPGPLQAQPSQEELRFGSDRSQWLMGFGHVGFNFLYNDQGLTPVTFTEVAPGVQLIGGNTHNMLLVEMSDHLVLVDAPFYESRSLKVLEEIKRRYTKPVRYLVMTHFHYDHTGGMRTFAAEGGVTVLAHTVGVPFYEEVLRRPHTVAPDRLEREKKPVTVKGVPSLERLTDSRGRVVELHFINTSHSEDMLVVYLPGDKLLYEADFFNPGPGTNGQPAFGKFYTWSGELYGEIQRLGLRVDTLAAGHGQGTATLEHLRIAGGR